MFLEVSKDIMSNELLLSSDEEMHEDDANLDETFYENIDEDVQDEHTPEHSATIDELCRTVNNHKQRLTNSKFIFVFT